MITHKLTHTAQSIASDTSNIETKCNSVLLTNSGSDSAKIYFNDDTEYLSLSPGDTLEIKADNENEIIYDTLKIEFETTLNPEINFIKQTKTLLVL